MSHSADEIVLLVSFYAPPSTAAAAARVDGLIRHLPKHAYRTILVTSTEGPGGQECKRIRVSDFDFTALLAGRLARGGRGPQVSQHAAPVRRSNRSALRRALYSLVTFPDQHWPWAIRCVISTRRDLARDRLRPAVIVTTSPPEASHLAGWALSLLYQVPWYADLRDLWSQNSYSKQTRVVNHPRLAKDWL